MSTTTCPACNAEISEGLDTCPRCNAPLDALNDMDGEVDNSAAIDRMLRSATQLLKDTEQFSFDDGEDDEEMPGDVPKPPEQPQLSSAQESSLNQGGVVDLSSLIGSPAPQPAAPAKKAVKKAAESSIDEAEEENAPELTEVDENGNPVEPQEEAADAADENREEEAADENKEQAEYLRAVPTPSKKSRKKVGRTSTALMIVWLAVMTVIGAAGGFFLRGVIFAERPTQQYKFAEKATMSLAESLSEEESLIVYEAYVKEGVSYNECVLYGGIRTAPGNVRNRWIRLSVNNDQPDSINIYYELEPEYYNSLIESGDEEDKILAAVLKNYDDTLKAEAKAIADGDASWIKVDANALNSKLSPFVQSEAAKTEPDETTPTESGASESDGEDITDIT